MKQNQNIEGKRKKIDRITAISIGLGVCVFVLIFAALPIYPIAKPVFVLVGVSNGYTLPLSLRIGYADSPEAPESYPIISKVINSFGDAFTDNAYVGAIYIEIEGTYLSCQIPTMNIFNAPRFTEFAVVLLKGTDGSWHIDSGALQTR